VSELFDEPDHATPLTPEERRALIPTHIAYRSELNEPEQENIARAQDWALGRKHNLLSEKFIRELHRRMLGDVWKWAGKFRTSERNLGIPFYEIPMVSRQLLDDAKAWIDYNTYPPDEVAYASITGWSRSIHSRMATAATPGSWRISWRGGAREKNFRGGGRVCEIQAPCGSTILRRCGTPTITTSARCSRWRDPSSPRDDE
jgi:hypothetical protein